MDIFFGFFGLGLAIALPILILIFAAVIFWETIYSTFYILYIWGYVLIYDIDPRTGKPPVMPEKTS